jgi:mRNA (guanine-N7-)-methyltransferase
MENSRAERDATTRMNKTKRYKSYFIEMRTFHNWVKRKLLDKYCINNSSLLDLSTGRGGDIDKWITNNLKRVEGYDIDPEAIKEATVRRDERQKELEFSGCRIEFLILDLSKDIIPSREVKFDIVTSMFAFHYMFDTEQSLNNILTSIDNNLRIGGFFIGCLFDNQALQNLLTSGFKSEHFRIVKKDPNCEEFYGNKIRVFIGETVLDKPTEEYIVNFNELTVLIESRGYKLIETQMFNNMYNTWTQYGDFRMNEDQMTLSFLNRYFVFQRLK